MTSQKELNEMSLEDFAKNLAYALADETCFAGPDASEASLTILSVAAERLDIADKLADIDSLGSYK